ncbi:hypothetical protein ACFW6X_00405 [Streptomyces bacillaris]|uniref:hypothetical protein n=1 Tax=Streptomyces bacillaris TaxID=68179 RepID=UPI0036C25281
MTDTTIAPEAGPQAPPDTTPPPAPAPQPDPAATAVDHTPGGWPVVPLAVTGTNTTTTLLAAAALVGGPAALAVAATGTVVLGAAAAAARNRNDRKTKPAKPRAGKSAGGGVRQGSAGRIPQQPTRSRSDGSASPRSRSTGGKSLRRGAGGAGLLGSASRARSSRKPSSRPDSKSAVGGASSVGGKSRGRIGQVKALREQARTVQPSRAARRAETTAARRSVADARRAAKDQARTASLGEKGPVGRAVARGTNLAGKARSAAVGRLRKAADAKAAGTVAQQRADVRKAPARKAARKALRKSAARFQGRRLLAALLAGALGIVGLISTPLGRKLGWAWLQNPGRRLYAHLTKTAAYQREQRDEAIRERLKDEEAAADAEAADDPAEQIGDTAERPAGVVPAPPTTETNEGEIVNGFRFEEHAAEMESAAQQYEPENAMEILAMVEGLPAAITSVANVMRILAERADSEFPLEKEVADGFNDIFGALMSAVAVAEDMGPLFRQAHEQDIARHEDPRNGPEAEKGWNV